MQPVPRERWERIEARILSPAACKAIDTKGRGRPEPKCPIRTDFQRDRDRIIHCKAFRRLKHKTQVFIAPELDHYRTRLTHTLEVSQIARTIARALCLNEDLTEAIALGHDLGHTPFGHHGEAALDAALKEVDPSLGFVHTQHSVRVADEIENEGAGLNLCWETLDGIGRHSKGMADIHEVNAELPSTLEGQVVRLSDRVAYLGHDLDDAIRAGMVKEADIPSVATSVLGTTHRERLDCMVRDIVQRSSDSDVTRMSDEVARAADCLKDFLYENVYDAPGETQRLAGEAAKIVKELFRHYMDSPVEMPPFFAERALAATHASERACVVADYVAGMTDRYARAQHAVLRSRANE
jgi:dGTPase